MPRAGRLIPIEAALHIMCRGNNRQNIFNREEDKLYYYSLLRDLKDDNNITIFHYCFMDNHLHLIVWLNSQSRISRFMKQINLCYFNYYKKIYGYSGHLWQGRFKSNIIDTDSYLLQCGKYIELNPVRANIVSLPEEYRFSSYSYYAKGIPDAIVTSSPAYIALSDSIENRRGQYIKFVVDGNIINTGKLMKQLFIGSDAFVKKLQEYYCTRNTRLKRGRPKNSEK